MDSTRWGLRQLGAVVAVIGGLLLTFAVPSSAHVTAQRTAPVDKRAKLKELVKQADALAKLYRGELHKLKDLEIEAHRALTQSKTLSTSLAQARTQAANLAQSAYMGGEMESAVVLTMGGDPEITLGRAATVSHLASGKGQQVQSIQALADMAAKASKNAGAKLTELQNSIKELTARKDEIQKQISRYGPQTTGANGLTGRMVQVKNEVVANFPMPYGIGCLRAGDPGEHGKGRACDFMMSTGGRMPGESDNARGDELAQWCIDNARRLGIMYIIWEQRIYDMRTGGGWRLMGDRGSITQNHHDHVHASVY